MTGGLPNGCCTLVVMECGDLGAAEGDLNGLAGLYGVVGVRSVFDGHFGEVSGLAVLVGVANCAHKGNRSNFYKSEVRTESGSLGEAV